MHFNINKDRAVCAPARTLVSTRGQGLAQREDSLVTTLKPFDIISSKSDVLPKLGYGLFWLALFVASLGVGKNAYAQACDQTITVNVAVLENPTVFNRLGAQNPNWITYALMRDVVHSSVSGKSGEVCQNPDGTLTDCQPGQVELRPDKRPRPLVVRSVEGACLDVTFTNLLDPNRANPNNAQQGQGTRATDPNWKGLFNDDQVAGRCASFQATGTEVRNIKSQGAIVGANGGGVGPNAGPKDCGDIYSGLAAPGETVVYNLYTPHEGAFIISSYGATIRSEANSGNLAVGMFGALNVEPKGARIYRTQVTEEEMRLATTGYVGSNCAAAGTDGFFYDNPMTAADETADNLAPEAIPATETVGVTCDPGGQPIINYEAKYPSGEPWSSEGKAGLPIINMLTAGNPGRGLDLQDGHLGSAVSAGAKRLQQPGVPEPPRGVPRVHVAVP
jgi:hypothetical protein